jgi:hypothetical protein
VRRLKPLVRGHDRYGLPATSHRIRLPGCTCRPFPCKGFVCRHPGHKGSRQTPWCLGHSPDCVDRRGNWCDRCWAREAAMPRGSRPGEVYLRKEVPT